MTQENRDGVSDAALDYTDESSTFGDRPTLAREAMGFDLARAGRSTGRPAGDPAGLDGRAEPRANRVQLLAGMLNVSMVWLMSGQGETPRRRSAEVQGSLADLARIRAEQARMADRLRDIERRLRAAPG